MRNTADTHRINRRRNDKEKKLRLVQGRGAERPAVPALPTPEECDLRNAIDFGSDAFAALDRYSRWRLAQQVHGKL